MKLITLNLWGGRIFEPLMVFLKKNSEETDVFCFQEIFNNPPNVKSTIQPDAKQNIYTNIEKVLEDYTGNTAPQQDNEESLAIFIKNNLEIKESGETFVYRWKNAMENNDASTYGVNVQYATLRHENKIYTICNLHGHWTPNFKGDNPARLEQSKNIKLFLDSIKTPKILCGDFNVAPDTESMAILETSMRNLVKEYLITSTRSHLYIKPVKFADYILVSPEIEIEDFKVFDDVVSDHLPLMLKFH
mgnify:CR=1 FL=1